MSANTLDLEAVVLKQGDHRSRETGVCLMEAVAWFADEPHSDHPQCCCPVLAAFGINLNDYFNDSDRQMLKPCIPLLVGTRSTREVERKRAYFLTDKALRVFAPIAIRAVPSHVKASHTKASHVLEKHALALEQLPELTQKSAATAAAAANAAAAAATAAITVWRTTATNAVDAARLAAVDAAWNAEWNDEWNADWHANIVETARWAAIAAVWAAEAVDARQAINMKAVEIFRQAIAIS